MVYSHRDVKASPYGRSVEQPDEERHRLLSVGVAASNATFQVRVRDGVVVELIRIELELCKDCRHISSQQLATSMPQRQTRSPEHEKITIQDVPASRLSNVDRSGGAITWTCSWKRTV
jgi:hypothetical protein